MTTVKLPNGVTVATTAIARRVSFDNVMLHCELQDGRIISVPLTWYPRLRRATLEQLNNWELIGDGEGIHWPDVNEDLPVRAFIAGCEESEFRVEASPEASPEE